MRLTPQQDQAMERIKELDRAARDAHGLWVKLEVMKDELASEHHITREMLKDASVWPATLDVEVCGTHGVWRGCGRKVGHSGNCEPAPF